MTNHFKNKEILVKILRSNGFKFDFFIFIPKVPYFGVGSVQKYTIQISFKFQLGMKEFSDSKRIQGKLPRPSNERLANLLRELKAGRTSSDVLHFRMRVEKQF